MNDSVAVVLYAGRWRGDGSFDKAVLSHRRHLLEPLARRYRRVLVAVATTASQWLCRGRANLTEAALLADLRRSFGRHVALAAVLHEERGLDFDGAQRAMAAAAADAENTSGIQQHMHPFYTNQIRSVVAQWHGVRHAYECARRAFASVWHDEPALLVRARFDVTLTRNLKLASVLDARTVYAEETAPSRLKSLEGPLFRPRFKDFLLFFPRRPETAQHGASPAHGCLDALMHALPRAHLAASCRLRCCGLCPEEQVEITLARRAGCTLAPLPGDVEARPAWQMLLGSWRSRPAPCANPRGHG
jgi:hypothetical protein